MSQQTVTKDWRNAALAVAVVAALGVAGCKKTEAPVQAPVPVASGPAPASSATAPAAASAAVETETDLLTKAKGAENDKRLYAPAGDNAIEYYLALRARNPNDATAKAALSDLFPYAMIATEQALQKASASKDPNQAQGFKTEAARIFALLERVDANAPSLPRLRATMEKEASAELKNQRDLDQKKSDADKAAAAAAAAAKLAASAPAAPQPAPVPTVTKPAPAPPPVVVQPVAPPPVATPQPEPVPVPKPVRAGMPQAVSSVQPSYPPQALRDGLSGQVTVAFTIDPDGSVSGATIVNSNPRRVFDAAALDAIRKWKFEPPGEPVPGHKTFEFNTGN